MGLILGWLRLCVLIVNCFSLNKFLRAKTLFHISRFHAKVLRAKLLREKLRATLFHANVSLRE
ncbi:MAG: hypothetical protein DRR00_24870, partial [Candidatus Parabeggiatoa sp. nov. 3]